MYELAKGDVIHVTYRHPLFGTVTATGRVLSTDSNGALADFNGVRTILTSSKLRDMDNVLIEKKVSLLAALRGG